MLDIIVEEHSAAPAEVWVSPHTSNDVRTRRTILEMAAGHVRVMRFDGFTVRETDEAQWCRALLLESCGHATRFVIKTPFMDVLRDHAPHSP